MDSSPAIVVYDASVLYPFHLRNLLVQLAYEGVVAARWTDAIHEEWIRSLAAKSGVPRARLLRTRNLMKAALPEADVTSYEGHLANLSLPDPGDLHVLAAAVAAGASIIVTWNLRHFPLAATAQYGIAAQDPDSFLAALHERDGELIACVVEAARANLRRTVPPAAEFLGQLERQGLARFVGRLRSGTP
jgi:hypothetical protein